jgi:hypothetical protein
VDAGRSTLLDARRLTPLAPLHQLLQTLISRVGTRLAVGRFVRQRAASFVITRCIARIDIVRAAETRQNVYS